MIPECPACNCKEHSCIGILGKLTYLRCRDCGIDYSVDRELYQEYLETHISIED